MFTFTFTRSFELLLTLVLCSFAIAGCDMLTDEDENNAMLGGSAETTLLGKADVDALSEDSLAWIAYESVQDTITHRHAPGFIYAPHETHAVIIDGEEKSIASEQALFIGQDVEHTHLREGRFWDVLLMDPETEPPSGLEDTMQVFASSDLQDDIPKTRPIEVHFVLVELPMDGQTSIHTHPGPEYIYVTRNDFIYQNAEDGSTSLKEGDDHVTLARVPVQKRNPEGSMAAFLSLFVVDPNEPFASPANF